MAQVAALTTSVQREAFHGNAHAIAGVRLRRLNEGLRRMTVAVTKTKAEQAILQQFEAVAARLPGNAAVASARGVNSSGRRNRPSRFSNSSTL